MIEVERKIKHVNGKKVITQIFDNGCVKVWSAGKLITMQNNRDLI